METRTFYYVYALILEALTTLQTMVDLVRFPILVRMLGAELLINEGRVVGAAASPFCGLDFAHACAAPRGIALYGREALRRWEDAVIDCILSSTKVEIEVLLASLPVAPPPLDGAPVPAMILDLVRRADEQAAAIADMETLADDLLDE